jgi:hypothetical protein
VANGSEPGPVCGSGATCFSACPGSGRSSRCTEPTRSTSPNGSPPPASSASDPQPTYRDRDRGTQGRGLHRHPRMAPAAPASLTSSPIDRTARNTAELDGRNTEDPTLALSGPRQRNAHSIHAPAVRIHRLVAELNPTGVSPGQTSRGSLFVPGSVSDVAFVRSWSAPIPKSGVQPGPPGSISRSRCPKPACRAAVQLVQVPPRTQRFA